MMEEVKADQDEKSCNLTLFCAPDLDCLTAQYPKFNLIAAL